MVTPDANPGLQTHPTVQAVRDLLRVTHGPAGRATRDAIEDTAVFAHEAATCGATGDHDAAADFREELGEQLRESSGRASPVVQELDRVWKTTLENLDDGDEGGETAQAATMLHKDGVEELVLAYLCAYPEFLKQVLVKSFIRQVSLGQLLMEKDNRRLDVRELVRNLEPSLAKHEATTDRIANECCAHLTQRSHVIAATLLQHLDLDRDGAVCRSEFLQAAPHAFVLAIENIAVSAGVQSLMADPDFADDFHMAMGYAMGLGSNEPE